MGRPKADFRNWSQAEEKQASKLTDGSRIAVIGGGPAGSFFSYFFLNMAAEMDLAARVDIYESRDFSNPAPKGCNMCGGIISESLVQMLAAEGIVLPTTVVQRGIDSYMLHMDVGSVRIDTPVGEKRIGAMHRSVGPRDIRERKWGGFDAHLLENAERRGARVVHRRVEAISRDDAGIRIRPHGADEEVYDLLVVAAGANSGTLKLFDGLGLRYRPPKTTKTLIREYYLGQETIDRTLGNSMHVFLLNIPRLEFAAIIPKGDYVTLALLGDDIDAALLQSFLDAPEVRRILPEGAAGAWSCQCSPKMNIDGAVQPYADRILFIGDSGVTRLYKDGIGAAYRTAKAAARAAIVHGVSEEDFRRHFAPACDAIRTDNNIGKITFAVTRQIQKRTFTRRAVLRMTRREQGRASNRPMSMVLWDMFTGSATYRDIFTRTLKPAFWGPFIVDIGASLTRGRNGGNGRRTG